MIAGGITQVNVPTLPAPLTASLALKFKGTRAEIERPHHLEIRFVDEDRHPSSDIHTIDLQFNPKVGSQIQPGVEAEINIVAELQSARINQAGSFMIDILLDGHSYKRLPLKIVAPGTIAA